MRYIADTSDIIKWERVISERLIIEDSTGCVFDDKGIYLGKLEVLSC